MEAAERDDDPRQDSVSREARRAEVVAPTSGREGSSGNRGARGDERHSDAQDFGEIYY